MDTKELKITHDELIVLRRALENQSCCNGVYNVADYKAALNGEKIDGFEPEKYYKYHGYSLVEIVKIITPLLSLMEKVDQIAA